MHTEQGVCCCKEDDRNNLNDFYYYLNELSKNLIYLKLVTIIYITNILYIAILIT